MSDRFDESATMHDACQRCGARCTCPAATWKPGVPAIPITAGYRLEADAVEGSTFERVAPNAPMMRKFG